MRRYGLSLVELIIVISIVSILLTLLIPAVLAVRESARLATCQSNIRQIGIQVIERIHSSNRLPENRMTFEGINAITESTWISSALGDGGTNQQTVLESQIWNCPSAPSYVVFEGLPYRFNGDDVEVSSRTMDYVGSSGVGSIRTPYSELEPTAKRRGMFSEMIGNQKPRNSASLTNGFSNTIMMWESVGALHYRAGETGKKGIEWDTFLESHGYWLSGDSEPEFQVMAKNFGTKAKYVLCVDGYATGNIAIFLRPDQLWTEPVGLQPVSWNVINVSNVARTPFSRHNNQCNFVFADGSTKTMPDNTEASVVMQMAQLAN
jgi:prepilin-type processing-associated H-X9-DG protein/prepilin-type N-terminal cleavage/methylation domain-containing protein